MTNFKREDYYGTGEYQPLDFWEQLHMPASLATMLKYIVRAGKKEGESKEKDLQKAKNYWDTFLSNLEDHVKFGYYNNYVHSANITGPKDIRMITDYLAYLETDGYDPTTINCIKRILNLSSELKNTYMEFNTFDEYFACFKHSCVKFLNINFEKLLKENNVK